MHAGRFGVWGTGENGWGIAGQNMVFLSVPRCTETMACRVEAISRGSAGAISLCVRGVLQAGSWT